MEEAADHLAFVVPVSEPSEIDCCDNNVDCCVGVAAVAAVTIVVVDVDAVAPKPTAAAVIPAPGPPAPPVQL